MRILRLLEQKLRVLLESYHGTAYRTRQSWRTIETKFQLNVHSIHWTLANEIIRFMLFHREPPAPRGTNKMKSSRPMLWKTQCPATKNSGSFLESLAGPCGGKTPQTNSVILARKRRKNFSMRQNDVHKRKRTEKWFKNLEWAGVNSRFCRDKKHSRARSARDSFLPLLQFPKSRRLYSRKTDHEAEWLPQPFPDANRLQLSFCYP